MKQVTVLGPEEETLADFTSRERRAPVINWYRTPVPREEMRLLQQRLDRKGFVQAGGYLGVVVTTGTLALYSAGRWPWYATAALVFLHGMVCAFMINAVHELGHGTVFKSKWLNRVFEHLFAFLGWVNHEKFTASHTRHHRYTLHPPDDLEVVLPVRLMVRHFLATGFADPRQAWRTFKDTLRIARGKFEGDWELTLYPENQARRKGPPIRWARVLLIGHGTIVAGSLAMGWWLLPVVLSLAPFYGGWLFFLCNNTQHPVAPGGGPGLSARGRPASGCDAGQPRGGRERGVAQFQKGISASWARRRRIPAGRHSPRLIGVPELRGTCMAAGKRAFAGGAASCYTTSASPIHADIRVLLRKVQRPLRLFSIDERPGV